MAKLPKPLQNVIDAFERLPGIGSRSAQRLGFYLVNVPEYELTKFADALIELKRGTVKCSICYNVSESEPCYVCGDNSREETTLLVVEQPIDVLNFEKMGRYKGQYHVLHGRIDPLNNIGPDDIYIDQLLKRLSKSAIKELILALNPDMEGEATAMYISKQLTDKTKLKQKLKITRLANGLPVGSSVEFADEITLGRALEGRREL
ncbi:recombination protein RecR [Candidatus Roizmanbacteria bacterium CG22_combo_CG10-13_8_21_14_all_38_20]|uniref:Recombination protein RecR n=1 Tax=Candidatus Roizmanbacteria bacterium CG22_combo_CG10-13_8_21_14_all_38_20 TaxID=1974862 RepID=A0A2H0BW02_9BACT|nr:recombination protein RecR [Candidatus Microgenomates bacterium]PIP61811.1 MAG: recombination protein RecR [Candidatus Roizmanbacteria bacterium CG22_combo_CG10-13_8_21_14_all_38_20]PJC31656.1 MAG: recombination protein RecR [Candidatus Roizmanbacteria bacterium CG_4_9_14_0_2_um_filter_38_17]